MMVLRLSTAGLRFVIRSDCRHAPLDRVQHSWNGYRLTRRIRKGRFTGWDQERSGHCVRPWRESARPGPGPFHHYIFEFYALDTKLDLPANTTREELLKAMDGHVIGKAGWFGRYHAPPPPPQ
jgi:Phosphatidylethanolamine-binding protein